MSSKCQNCGDEMETIKLLLHEGYCKTNIKLCEYCGEKVVIIDLEDHIKTLHSMIDCKHCGKKFEPNILEKHREVCKEEEKYQCKFCLLEMDITELIDHEYICGCKTELCEICGSFVAIKDMDQHLSLDCFVSKKEEEIKRKEETNSSVLTKKGLTKIPAYHFYKTEKMNRLDEESINMNNIPQVKDKSFKEDSDFESKERVKEPTNKKVEKVNDENKTKNKRENKKKKDITKNVEKKTRKKSRKKYDDYDSDQLDSSLNEKTIYPTRKVKNLL